VGEHLAMFRDRRIIIATAQCDDRKYYVRSVKVEVKGVDGGVEVDDMPYLDTAHSDEEIVVEKALEDASAFARDRYE